MKNPGTRYLHSVHFIDLNTGYTVGFNNTGNPVILKTSDGGNNWVSQNPGTTNSLSSVYFTDVNKGYAAGSSGTVLKTTNGGALWSVQNSGTSHHLESIFFTNATTGYAVGDQGFIMKTTNEGITWSPQTFYATNSHLSSVCFPTESTGYIVGHEGKILKTTDGGQNWVSKNSGTTNKLNSVHFSNENNGFAVGENGILLGTLDGGNTWTIQNSGTSNRLNAVFALDDQYNGFAVGDNGTVIQVDHFGNYILHTPGTSVNLYSVFFNNSNSGGYIVGENGTILLTYFGIYWYPLCSGTNNTLFSVYFPTVTTGYAAGSNGTLLKTTDGGCQWTIVQETGPDNMFFSLHFEDASLGYLINVVLSKGTSPDEKIPGDRDCYWGAVFKTTDGGVHWTNQLPYNFALQSLSFTNATTGYCVGSYGKILKTTNGGGDPLVHTLPASGITESSASLMGTVNPNGQETEYHFEYGTNINYGNITPDKSAGAGTIALNVNAGITGLTPGATYHYRLVAVNNIGTSYGNDVSFTAAFVPASLNLSGNHPGASCFNATGTITVAGNGTTFCIPDGGYATLIAGQKIRFLPGTSVEAGGYLYGYITTSSTYCGPGNYALTGYATGLEGTILKTVNGGKTWHSLISGTTVDLYSSCFTDLDTGYVVGDSGKILKTINGGATWTSLTTGTIYSLRSVCFVSPNKGFATGGHWQTNGFTYTDGIIIKTEDGGATWTTVSPITDAFLTSVYFSDATTGYAAGTSGSFFGNTGEILKTNDGGLTWNTVVSETDCGFSSVYFLTENEGFALGSIDQQYFGPVSGFIRNTLDGGTTWALPWADTAVFLNSVHFANTTTGFAAGSFEDWWSSYGKIYKTIDGGMTWTPVSGDFNFPLRSVYMTDDKTVYSVGENGTIIKSINGGLTWAELQGGTTNPLTSVVFPDIIQRHPLEDLQSLDPIKEEDIDYRPGSFQVSNFIVYPNPTNDNFVVGFSPEFQKIPILIRICGIHGEELLHQQISGETKAEFSLSGRPRGIYWILIESSLGTQAKKIIKI